MGLLNATEMNQGTYCFLVIGAKKPQVLLETINVQLHARLDTNRHMLDDELCGRFDRIGRLAGGTLEG